MKAVLISIRPKWCELIVNGQKTIEVRKTRPKLETPFKCYIYCTKPKKILRYVWGKEDYAGYGEPYTQMQDNEKVFVKIPDGSSPFCSEPYSGKVIGEFVCDDVENMYEKIISGKGNEHIKKGSCLSGKDLNFYAKGKILFAWHIAHLKIYDAPKKLSEFHRPILPTGLRYEDDGVKRPPQSWCYVEGEQDG